MREESPERDAVRKAPLCPICGEAAELDALPCAGCATLQTAIAKRPDLVRRLWKGRYGSDIERPDEPPHGEAELPEVLDARRYRTVDRDGNKWYLSVSELEGRPVEIFASTAFDRDHELQSRIANLTTITRLLSMVLRHLSLGEPLSYEKCVKQVQRSSRQKNDLPDMLANVLARYAAPPEDSRQP